MKKLLISLFFLTSLSFADEFTISDLSGGMQTYPSSNRIPDNAASFIQNFYTDQENIAVERNGYEKRDSTVLGGGNDVNGLWEFIENDGDQWIISFSSRTFYKNTVGGTPTQFGPQMSIDQAPDCAVNLGVIMCVNGTDTAWYFNGTSTGAVSGAPLGKLIEPWRTRFIISNITGAQSTVRVSEDGSYTNWTIGSLSTDPFSLQIGGANDGFNVTCIWKSYLDNFVIGRKKDLWYLSGFDQSDVQVRNVSSEIGCIQQGSMREFDGSLLFLSNRGMEELRGYTITHISEPIRNITDTIVKNTSSERSNIQTSLSDWQQGTISPADSVSLTVAPGSVFIGTATAISFFRDNSAADFSLGTSSNITVLASGSIQLSTSGVEQVFNSTYTAPTPVFINCYGPYYMARSFTSTNTFALSSITLYLSKTSSSLGDFAVYIKDDDSTTPGDILTSSSLLSSSISTGGGDVTITFSSPFITLESGTRYWIQLVPQGICDPSLGVLAWWGISGSPSTEYIAGTSISGSSPGPAYKTSGYGFKSTGTLTSQSFDMGFTTQTWIWNWQKLDANGTIPSGTSAVYETQTSSNATDWTSLATVSTGSAPTSTVQQYIRYRVSLSSGNTGGTPVIDEIAIVSTERRKPSGGYTSKVIDAGASITSWGPLQISDQKVGGNITYEFNSATSSTIADFNPSSWTTITSGQVPTNQALRYFAFRSSFTASVGTATVSLDDFTTTWNEGGALAPPIVSWTYDRRYWLAYTTSTASSPYNDRVLVYQRNRTWTLLSGINAASFATWRDALYFGAANDVGYVYKFDVGGTDDGSSILSIIRTKSYDLGQSFRDKEFRYVYPSYLGNSSLPVSFTLGYYLNRGATLYSVGSAGLDDGSGQLSPRMHFPVSNPLRGREIQYEIRKDTTGDRLRIYSLSTVFMLRQER